MKVSLCQNIKSPKIIGEVDIPTILHQISSGKTKQEVIAARKAKKGSVQYDYYKSNTVTWTPNGTFLEYRRKDCLIELSGFIYLDIDSEIEKKSLAEIPFVNAFWKSFSGEGYGLLVKVDDLNLYNYLSVWKYLDEYFKKKHIPIDPQAKDISRQNVISYDPDLYRNTSCVPINADELVSNDTMSTFEYSERNFTRRNIQFEDSTITGDSSTLINISNNSADLIYKTELDNYQGKDFIVIEEGKPYRDCYVPKSVKDGNRHRWLAGRTISLLFNNPNISYDFLLNNILYINKSQMAPPKNKKEVINLVQYLYKEHLNGSLNYNPRMKKIWINPDVPFTTTEKKKIIGKEVGKMRRKKTTKLLQNCYDNIRNVDTKVTQKMLAENSGISIRTVKDYWHQINRY
jgi:hypothetical protein